MAKDELAPFLSLGPFLGMNTADAQPFVPQGYATLAKNANTYRHKGALMPERGRISLDDFGTYLANITVLTEITPTVNGVEENWLLIQGTTNVGGLVTLVFNETTSAVNIVSNALVYTQAVQYGQIVYTNGGQKFFAGWGTNDPNYPKFYTWQYTGIVPGADLEAPLAPNGSIFQETRFYVFTQVTLLPDGTTTETSPENFGNPSQITINSVNVGPNGNYITLTPGTLSAHGTFLVSGTPITGQYNNYIIGGTTIAVPQITGNTPAEQAASDAFFLNQSTIFITAYNVVFNVAYSAAATIATGGLLTLTATNPGPQGNITTTSASTTGGDTLTAQQANLTGGSATGGVQFTGLNAGPNGQRTAGVDGTTYTTNIYAQSSLQEGYFLVGNAATNNTFVDNTSDEDLATNTPLLLVDGSAFQRDPPPLGPFGVPVNRVITNLPFIGVWQNVMFVFTHIDANIIEGSPPTTQWWYSLPGQPDYFSSDTRALLLQDNIELGLAAQIGNVFDYNAPVGDYAKACAPVGSYLMCCKRRETWLVYGNGTTASPFTQQRIFDFGTQSIRSVTACVGGAFFLTENGVYFFDGNTPQYEETKFRTVNTDALNIRTNDSIRAVGVFSNMTYYLFYPTLGKGYGYNTITGEWMSELEYAPCNENAISFTPAENVTNASNTSLINRVVSARYGLPSAVDFLFADPVNDLGSPQNVVFAGPDTDAPGTDFKKEYTCLTVYAPVQQGFVNVDLTVDGNLALTKSFDLSAQRPLIANFHAQGFSAQITVTVQSTGTTVPEIWKVQVWGINPPSRRLGTPQ
jgi:hypothetical protein